ncbi:hypothetical protein OKW98_18505 [Pseudomonas sp. KU26590]|uniref:hypothetical protein n=1 Tax=Pseudomonas sp. KU26590 TaxID=2991051 RepID=UPI00223D788D|nr:hypothetical protein [Pseudomonas sp. KU26590]UZJ58569.1 hypothetical protein OKW98_18505 [Pseudomonas sp. KU26590]
MKLILKRITPGPRCMTIDEMLGEPPERPLPQPFALHVEDGEILPGQSKTCMSSDASGQVVLTVTFIVDGRNVMVQGDAFGE